jgi:hypothetical protein
MRIIFRNLDRSQLALEAAQERLSEIVDKFPKLRSHKMNVTLFMENSPQQAGPDSFGVKVLIQGDFFKNITLIKKSDSLYRALADVKEHLLEVLNRTGDKVRVVKRRNARRLREAIPTSS